MIYEYSLQITQSVSWLHASCFSELSR